jgi:hypothetical protein
MNGCNQITNSGRLIRNSAFLSVVALSASLYGQDGKPNEKYTPTEGEAELISILEDHVERKVSFLGRLHKIEDLTKRLEYRSANDPRWETVPKLLSFESDHRGTEIALAAANWLARLNAGRGPNSPAAIGRRELLRRLPSYGTREDLAGLFCVLVNVIDAGLPEPQVESFLRTVIANSSWHVGY